MTLPLLSGVHVIDAGCALYPLILFTVADYWTTLMANIRIIVATFLVPTRPLVTVPSGWSVPLVSQLTSSLCHLYRGTNPGAVHISADLC